jgi:two-component system OmpR family sensor kinase
VSSSSPVTPPSVPAARWPWQRSLQYRIIFAYGAVIILTLSILSVWIAQIVYRSTLDSAQHDLEVTAFLASNVLEDPLSGFTAEFDQYKQWEESQDGVDDTTSGEGGGDEGQTGSDSATVLTNAARAQSIALPRLQQVATIYASDAAARVTILDTSGNVLADSVHLAAGVPSQAQAPEFKSALAGAARSDVRPDEFSAQSTLYAAAPIQQGDRVLGVVQISKTMSEVTAGVRQVLISLGVASLIALAIASLLAIWIGQRLVRPVRELEDAAIAVAQGDFTQTVAVESSDELGALAGAFNHMVGEVRSMLDQQRIFVANASHELRTPLTNIKLRSEALRAMGAEDAELTNRYLAELDSEADRLTRLANDLLDLAILEEASIDHLPAAPVDIAPYLLKAAEVMQMQAEQANLTLGVDVPPSLPLLRVHPDHVEGVVVNLLDNAIKYTPAGGAVRLTANITERKIAIRVQDDGLGIPSEDLPHIFDRFYRVDRVRSRRKGAENATSSGAGLGLSIVKELVQLNGGQITVESTPDSGTLFVISFPKMA